MIVKGTLNDRINSLSLLVQKNPTRGLSYLGQIMKEARKKNRK
jgi:ribosome biogenesis protein MAK21